MKRVALLASEPLRAKMAGIGLRYLELARRLPAYGFETVVITAGDPAEVPDVPGPVRRFEQGRLSELTGDCAALITQGQLGNDAVLECPHLPVVIDLYDPWLIENLHYTATLGLDPYKNDHASWVLQMARGDFFLCSSEEQRHFYLGFLTALGRVNPERLAADPTLERLIAAVPFGLDRELPPHQPVLPPRQGGLMRRLLFGGLYDWYDPWTLLAALTELEGDPWTLLVVENPNPHATPQRLFAEVRAWCDRRSWWGSRVVAIPWVPFERRYDLLRDVDLLVATHRPSLETELALRTRFLDAFAAGCPALTSAGGTVARLMEVHGAGWVVPPGDAGALAASLREALAGGGLVAQKRAAARELAETFAWERVLAPLIRFLAAPALDPTKERFAFRPGTASPPDALGFRVRRYLRRRWEALTKGESA